MVLELASYKNVTCSTNLQNLPANNVTGFADAERCFRISIIKKYKTKLDGMFKPKICSFLTFLSLGFGLGFGLLKKGAPRLWRKP